MIITHTLQIPYPVLIPLLACALHRTWFGSNLAPHTFHVLKLLGLGRKPGFWTPDLDELHYYPDWFRWINTNTRVPAFWAELLTCPTCLSWHVPFWAVAVATPTPLISCPLSAVFWYVVGVFMCLTLGGKSE